MAIGEQAILGRVALIVSAMLALALVWYQLIEEGVSEFVLESEKQGQTPAGWSGHHHSHHYQIATGPASRPYWETMEPKSLNVQPENTVCGLDNFLTPPSTCAPSPASREAGVLAMLEQIRHSRAA